MNGPANLSAKSLRAVKWNYLGTVGRIMAQFISQIALARLIGPEATGVFGFAFLIAGLCALILEMGLGAALVQVREMSDRALATACGRLLLSGAILAICMYAAADALAEHVFAAPQAAPILKAMAPSLMIAAAAFPAAAVLKREIEFKVIQIAELGSYIFGYVFVGIGAAWYGLGVWSLVLAWYAQTGMACALLYIQAPRSLIPGNPFRSLELSRFGAVVMFTNLLNWTIEYGTHLLVGRLYGAASLGLFTLANNLVRTPANHLVTNLQSVLFPIAARAQGNDAGLRRAYLTVLSGVALIAFPVFAYVAAMASPIVALLLGPKWAQAAQVLVPLSLAMIPHVAMAICGPVLNGRGEPHIELRAQAGTVAMLLAAIALSSQWSFAAMAWALSVVYLLRCLWMTGALVTRLRVPAGEFWHSICGPIVLGVTAAACALGTVAALGAMSAVGPTPMLELAVSVPVTTAAIAAIIWSAPSWVLGPYLRRLITELVANRPAVAALPGFRRIFGNPSGSIG